VSGGGRWKLPIEAGMWIVVVAMVLAVGVAALVIRYDVDDGVIGDLRRNLGIEPAPPERHLLPDGFSGWTEVRYAVPEAAALPVVDGAVLFEYPSSGRIETSSKWVSGVRRHDFEILAPSGRQTISELGPDRGVWGRYTSQRIGKASGPSPQVDVTTGFFVGSREEHVQADRPPGLELPELEAVPEP
jgi:hypothetical protein